MQGDPVLLCENRRAALVSKEDIALAVLRTKMFAGDLKDFELGGG